MRYFLLICFLSIVHGPLAAIAIAALASFAAADRGSLFESMLLSTRQWNLLGASLLLAASVTAGALIAGVLVGSRLGSWRGRAAAYARWLVLVSICVPSCVHAMAWTDLARYLSSVFGPMGFEIPAFTGWLATWWVAVMTFLPLAVGMTLIGLASVDPELLEAGRVHRTDAAVFARIALPLAMPQILAAGGLIFILSLTDYVVPSLFQVNVYAFEIFVRHSGGGPLLETLWLVVPLLATAAVAVTWLLRGIRDAVTKPIWRHNVQAQFVWPAWLATVQWTAVAVMAAQIAVPLVSASAAVASRGGISDAIQGAGNEFATSLLVAIVAGCLSVPIAFAVAACAVRGRHDRLWWFLAIAPLLVPAPLTGIGLILLWNHPVVGQFYGTLAMPVLAAMARFTPVAVLIAAAQLRRIDPLLFDAARVFQRSTIRTYLQIRIPMIAPGLLAGACAVAVLSIGELGATLIVAPPGRATAAMRMYSYLHYGASESVAGLSLMLVAATVVCASLLAFGIRFWKQVLPNHDGAQGNE